MALGSGNIFNPQGLSHYCGR